MIRRLLLALPFLLALPAAGARGQTRPAPGLVLDGKVVVRVLVTLSDEQTRYQPVGDHTIVLYRGQRDSIVLTTDEAGVVSTLLPAGEYRLVSRRPVEWKGRLYSWNLPVTIARGAGLIDLRMENARVGPPGGAAPATVARGPVAAPAAASAGRPPVHLYKDPGTATLIGFLVAGGGQMYAGETGKGVALLLGSAALLGGGWAITASRCDDDLFEDCDWTPLGVGAGGALLLWIYGIVDAGPAARRHNARLGIPDRASVAPILAPAPGGARLGLALRM